MARFSVHSNQRFTSLLFCCLCLLCRPKLVVPGCWLCFADTCCCHSVLPSCVFLFWMHGQSRKRRQTVLVKTIIPPFFLRWI
ncbi:hypothetical protein BX070DRAFT_228779 [Coemansia spiralis]|nr:hypothetical protein BX070DRAFT_228779 [Coemansia spiralis]